MYIMCSALINPTSREFQVKTVYVVSEESSWIITESTNWEPLEQVLDLTLLQSMNQSQRFSTAQITYSDIRKLPDDDAKSFAYFLKDKLRQTVGVEFSKKLFKTLSNIGEEV